MKLWIDIIKVYGGVNMKSTIKGLGIDLTDELKSHVEKSLNKLDKFFTEETTAHVALKTQKNDHIVEITIPIKGNILRVSERGSDMYSLIDVAVDKLERQVRKYRTKVRDNKIHKIMKNDALGNISSFEDNDDNDDSQMIEIVKKKHFELIPMSPEEACEHMELLNHNFFMFENNENNKVCVVYKRIDGSYGLIES